MKHILIIIFFTNFLWANYSIYYQGIKLGEIDNFECLQKNSLEANVTNSIARFLLGKDKFTFYNDLYKGDRKDKNTKFKKDKYQIINILRRAVNNNIKSERIQINEEKYIDVKVDKNYQFVYNSKGKIKSKGHFIIKNGKLIEFIEEKNSIKIVKNKNSIDK